MTAPSPISAEPGSQQAGRSVLFFDGECGLCNRIVRLLLRLDRTGRLQFAPLQGRSAQDYLRAHGLPTGEFETLVFVPDWAERARPEYLVRTAGVIAALRVIENPWAGLLGGFLRLIPSPVRDAAYRIIGRLRYRIFGPWRPRPLPRPEWAARFLE